MLKTILIVLLLLPNQTVWANDVCPEDVQVIEKGQTANCSGVLLSPEASKKADEAIEDSKYYKELSEKLYQRQNYTTKEIDILEKRVDLWINQSELLSEQLVKKENQNEWQKVIYFSLGLITVGIAAYGTSKLDR